MELPKLKDGDKVCILAPAKAIEHEHIDYAKEQLTKAGFEVMISEHCLGRANYFSGTIAERTSDLQEAINDDQIKAIFCARGGYGCIQVVDRINWAGFMDQPKWIVGFSDVTVFHQHLSCLQVPSLHATMPLNYKDNSSRSLTTMIDCLKGEPVSYEWSANSNNIEGSAQGVLIGGNLAVLCGLIGTNEMPSYLNTILFLEDVGEHLYAVDRYFHQLSKAGVFDQIRGLVVGGFTNMRDTEPGFGCSLAEIIRSHFNYRSVPIAFDFPAGHMDDNCALAFGKRATLKVENKASLSF